ncbi:hypothetical protein [Aeromonas caviae]|uniref:hypothetical protein n=1 Tax=Aeromonas caviae TaxID=648 RepID=UPI0011198B96|nr:hypothetical protein [Aeromonas caviae]
MSKLLIIGAVLFISACTPEPKQPYECFNLEQPESEWRCTYLGKEMVGEDLELMRVNIKNSMKE